MKEDSLERFVEAQESQYHNALAEIRAGRKRSHWMWFIFPQIRGLGMSSTSQYYGIKNLTEAGDYLNHKVLGPRLIEISRALLELKTENASQVFGSPDDLKLRSSMTLFSLVEQADKVFEGVLAKFFSGKPDNKTIQLSGKH